jgi:LysR family nitrogen assimilation transcriptional regulator
MLFMVSAIPFGYGKDSFMNLKYLRHFITVADAGSLTAAAAVIPMAQPALTRQMRELEEEMGALLLQRLPRGVRLTQAGVTFYESAQRMLSEAAQLKQRLSKSQANPHATVVLGVSPSLAKVLLPGLIEKCQDSMEGLVLRTREAFTPTLLDWLQRGVIDMAIVTNPEPLRAVSLQALLGEPFALVSHPAMRVGPVVSVNQLTRIPLLMTSLHRRIVENQMSILGKSLNLQAEIDSVDAICELIDRARWATVMPVSVFKNSRHFKDVVLSEISGVQLNRMLVMATRMEPKPQAAQAMVQELVEAEFSRLSRLGVFSFASQALLAETISTTILKP